MNDGWMTSPSVTTSPLGTAGLIDSLRAQPRAYWVAKRAVDMLGASVLLVLVSPLMIALTAVVALQSGPPVLFRQTRVSARRVRVGNRSFWETYEFTLLKFRTMAEPGYEADRIRRAQVRAYIQGDAATGRGDDAYVQQARADFARAATFKMRSDPRITRLGRWLRARSLDELPQLFNVLRGDISLVGPRPSVPYEVGLYSPESLRRLATKPGLTGLWQVSGRGNTTFDEMVALDIRYIQQQSLRSDFVILLRTVPAVLAGDGAG